MEVKKRSLSEQDEGLLVDPVFTRCIKASTHGGLSRLFFLPTRSSSRSWDRVCIEPRTCRQCTEDARQCTEDAFLRRLLRRSREASKDSPFKPPIQKGPVCRASLERLHEPEDAKTQKNNGTWGKSVRARASRCRCSV